MYKVIAVYKQPEDKETFDKYYSETHTPLTLKIPGMTEFRTNRVFGGPAGESDLYLVAEMCFADKDGWKAAMKTKEMMESGKDAMSFAGKLVSVHFAEETVTKL